MTRTIVFLFVVAMCGLATAATVHVPADQPTIQAGIDAASEGDTVLVAPGVYYERILWEYKPLVVQGAGLFATQPTVIAVPGEDEIPPGVAIHGVEGAEFSGFVVQDKFTGYALHCVESTVNIHSNVFRNNVADIYRRSICYLWDTDGAIRQNVFRDNRGSGMRIRGGSVLTIENNTFYNNKGAIEDEVADLTVRYNSIMYCEWWGLSGEFANADCNHFYGNEVDYDDGTTPGPADVYTDPMFCGPESLLVAIDSASVLAPANNSCGQQIGISIPIGCEACYDIDGDSVCLSADNCPAIFNPDQDDFDTDSLGDLCDNCPEHYNPDQADADEDGVGDLCDLCPDDYDPEQVDTDGDGFGDVCDICPEQHNDIDADLDGMPDLCDNCPTDYNVDQQDSDNDGIGDVCDACPFDDDNDVDSDGLCANEDNCPDVYNPDQANADGDDRGDACDSSPNLCCNGYYAGNINCDPGDNVDVSDLTALVNHLFVTFEPLCCAGEANVNGDLNGDVDIADLSWLVYYLFIGFPGAPPCI